MLPHLLRPGAQLLLANNDATTLEAPAVSTGPLEGGRSVKLSQRLVKGSQNHYHISPQKPPEVLCSVSSVCNDAKVLKD